MIRNFLLVFILFGPMAFAVSSQMDDTESHPLEETIYVYNVWALPGDEAGTGTIYLEVENNGPHPIAPLGLDADAVTQIADANERGRGPTIAPGEASAPGAFRIELSGMDAALEPGAAFPFSVGFIQLDEDENALDEPFTVRLAALIAEEEPDFPAAFIIANPHVRATVSAEMAAQMDELDSEHGDNSDIAAGIPPSAAYMTLRYRGDDAEADEPFGDSLVAAETSAAGVVEIHTTEIDGDVMRMRQIDGVPFSSEEPGLLQPGGDHVMLMQLPADLLPGEAITLTLVFESGLEVTIAAPVVEIQRRPMMDMNE